MADTIAIASDHAGYPLKSLVAGWLRERGLTVLDLGCDGPDSVDYPDFGYAVATAVADGRATQGVLVCGSGIGISIAANRHPAARAALCQSGLMARLAREHNDANILVMGARLIGEEVARDCLDQFLNTPFAGGRHQRRIDKLSNPVV